MPLKVPRAAVRVLRDLTGGVLGARAGTEMGPEAPMRAWFGPKLEEIQKLDDVLDLSAADPEKRGEYESVLKQVWSKLVAAG